MSENLFRKIPQVSRVIEHPTLSGLRERFHADEIADTVRTVIDGLRSRLQVGAIREEDLAIDWIADQVVDRLHIANSPMFRPVINATGIVLHTNLGRSSLADRAAIAAWEAARGYLNLEIDLESGQRSNRQNPIREGVCRITGAESATAVNNCAAATVITLRALAAGKEVIVSRGQLIEIGGSFRIPEIMSVSGAILREVGTTNRTRISDYAQAIGPNTGLLMRIHTSNFRIRGFTESVGIDELVALGRQHQIPVVDDVGSGSVVDLSPFGLPGEPIVSEGIAAGADLVMFSGDKLLGGPQAGIIAGARKHIDRIESDPLMRAFRLDKMTLAALEATLRLYRNPIQAMEQIHTLRMLTMPIDLLAARTHQFAERLAEIREIQTIEVRDDVAFVGGGSLPDVSVPTKIIAITVAGMNEETLAHRLRTGSTSVVGRVQRGQWLLDLRTVFDRQLEDLLKALKIAIQGVAS